ncbi:MAG: hypothetical protein WCO00_09895 [Rhodospirillaceae bacterium]
MALEVILILVMSLLAVTATVPLWRRRLHRARGLVRRNQVGADKISKAIREQARKTLHIKREIKRVEGEYEIIQTNIEAALKAISVLEQVDDRIWVVEDNRLRADLEWVGVVSQHNYRGTVNRRVPATIHNAWKAGRKCLVWAQSEDGARTKLTALFPAERGFSPGKVVSLSRRVNKDEG